MRRACFQQLGVFGVLIVCLNTGCLNKKTPEPVPGENEFSVMTYNLRQYSLQDRDGDGQPFDPKPDEERRAVIEVIAQEAPDVLVVQEMGDQSVLQEFIYALLEEGLQYENVEYLRRGKSQINMVVLSRFPFVGMQSHLKDTYSIGDAKLPVARGFIDVDIQVNSNYVFKLLGAHLKAKVFSPLGQTEMRRNEARLLNKHVRKALNENAEANVLVVGDLNDTINSAALREVLGKRKRCLFDIRPKDEVGDVWTHVESERDGYERIDYMLVSEGMTHEVMDAKTHAVRHPKMMQASDHRPLVAFFQSRDVLPAQLEPVATPESL